MTKKVNNTEVEAKALEATSNSPMYVGVITAKEKEALEKEHGKIRTLEINVNESEVSVAYYKVPSRPVKAKALSLYTEKKIVETGDLLIANCFVAGDKRQKEHPDISLSAAVLINGSVTFLEGELKN